LEKLILRKQAMIMCAKTSQKDVAKMINSLGELVDIPNEMEFDPDAKHFYKQHDVDYEVRNSGGVVKAANRLKLNLYFDPVRRAQELVEIQTCIHMQKLSLDDMHKSKAPMPDDAAIKRDYCYHTVLYEPDTRFFQDFKLNEKKIEKIKSNSGFFFNY
jgi:hypothetical protein